jgi:hypothetical protein
LQQENRQGFWPCTRGIDIDTSTVISPRPAEKLRSSRAPKLVVVLMIIIVASLALVAVFASIQRIRHDQIEKTVVTLSSSPTPQQR